MNHIFLNTDSQIRLIWRFLIFVATTVALNFTIQSLIREAMQKSLTRGNILSISVLFSVLASLYVVIRFVDKSSLKKYGLMLDKKWVAQFMVGIIISVVQLAVFFAIMYFTGNLTIQGYFVTSSSEFTFLQGFSSEALQNLAVGISEEVFFRAFLFYIAFESISRISKNRPKNAWIACMIISPFFGFAHLFNEGASIYSSINLSFDALMICIPFLITGRLGMSIGMHFAWNFTQGAILGFANSGFSAKSSLVHSVLADNILTGGAFGTEGSVLLVVLDLIAVLMMVFWKKFTGHEAWVHEDILHYEVATPHHQVSLQTL